MYSENVIEDIVDRVRRGEKRTLGRLMTLVENGAPEAREIMRKLHAYTGGAHLLGITGSPGVGKSTLVDRLTAAYRAAGRTVGVVAVDPTSPFSGGAILGDRVRMPEIGLDPGVFIRSMATRGHLGGVALTTGEIIKILDASGKDVVIVETVGAGQSEVEIMELVDTTMVVLAPGLGDGVQAIKAGILEIGDIFVVNKADREGTEQTVAELEAMLDLGEAAHGRQFDPAHFDPTGHHGLSEAGAVNTVGATRVADTGAANAAGIRTVNISDTCTAWRPPVLKTVARDDVGISELRDQLDRHLAFLEKSGLRRKRMVERFQREIVGTAVEQIVREILGPVRENGMLKELAAKVAAREMDPHTAVELILGEGQNGRR
ncbi:MAG: methylmalonyl Co-A mutase-associated GTPase MeaB [Syntrophothermus sp.]